MNKKYDSIDIHGLKKISNHAQPPEIPEVVHIDDPASAVLNSFQYVAPATINACAFVTDALLEMKAFNEHLLLVLNDDKHMIGILTSHAIHGEQPYRIMHQRGLKHSELIVKMLMVPNEKIACLPSNAITHSKVGNIIETLKANKRHYILVIDEDTEGKHIVTGYFSATQINKKLEKRNKEQDNQSNSILELAQLLKDLDS